MPMHGKFYPRLPSAAAEAELTSAAAQDYEGEDYGEIEDTGRVSEDGASNIIEGNEEIKAIEANEEIKVIEDDEESGGENESQSSKLSGAGFDVLHDNDGDESSQEGAGKDGVLPESAADAGALYKEGASSGSPDRAGGGADQDEAAQASGGEEADAQHGGGSGPGSEASERGSDAGGAAESDEVRAVQEAESETEAEPGPEREKPGTVLLKYLEEALSLEAETGEEESAPVPETAESAVPREELLQIHEDLQVISCFMVVFIVIMLCHYSYRFFKIFF